MSASVQECELMNMIDRDYKIEKLQSQLEAANKIIEVLENPNNWGNHKGIDCYLYNQALAEVEKIRNGGEG